MNKTLRNTEFSKDDWKLLVKNVKWLNNCTSKDVARATLHNIQVTDTYAVANDGFKVGIWRPEDTTLLNTIPAGLWQVSTVNNTLIDLLPAFETNYPNVAAIINGWEKGIPNIEAESVVVDCHFDAKHFNKLTAGFAEIKISVGSMLMHIELSINDICENYGVLMLVNPERDIAAASIRQTKELSLLPEAS